VSRITLRPAAVGVSISMGHNMAEASRYLTEEDCQGWKILASAVTGHMK
jgi:hypothetical protein